MAEEIKVTAENLFFRPVDGNVTKPLELRKAHYGSLNRSSSAHAWLYQKMAYATAKATTEVAVTAPTGEVEIAGQSRSRTKTGGEGGLVTSTINRVIRSAELKILESGGIGNANSLYGPNDYPKSDSFTTARFLPKPHITSVKISNEGDYGSLRKCELVFSVYSLDQLSNLQAFFDIGGNLKLEYGWNKAGEAGGDSGYFEGKIYNFSYNINTNGGFDCISYGIGAGIGALAANTLSSAKEDTQVTDSLNVTIKNNNIVTALQYYKSNNANLQSNNIEGGIGVVMYPTNWLEKPGPGIPDFRNIQATVPHYYISLELLISVLNKKVFQAAGGSVIGQIQLICDNATTKSNVPKPGKDSLLVSGNPFEILFPGYGEYGDKTKLNFDTYATFFQKGDLSKTMINIDWLITSIHDMTKKKDDSGKSTNITIAKFLGIIFDSIYYNSGTRFKLAIVQDPKNHLNLRIADANYTGDRSSTNAYELTAMSKNSICRNISLSSKVPSEMATAAFITTASTLSSHSNAVAALMAGENSKDRGTPADDSKSALDSLKDVKNIFNGTDIKDFSAAISNLKSALQRCYTFPGKDNVGYDLTNESIPFPLNFSATLDGIEGFEFGQVVTTNYLPARYRNKNVAFTITKVEHSIQNNDWSTTLSTVCRLLPDYGA